MIAYLAVLNNPEDDLRLTRIINNPPRGIGPGRWRPPRPLPGGTEALCMP